MIVLFFHHFVFHKLSTIHGPLIHYLQFLHSRVNFTPAGVDFLRAVSVHRNQHIWCCESVLCRDTFVCEGEQTGWRPPGGGGGVIARSSMARIAELQAPEERA